MGNRQVRIGQLIAPFGPGSIYIDRSGTPLVICGLDHWYKRWDRTQRYMDCDDRSEFEKIESRLSRLLKVDRFCAPPDYRINNGSNPPPNASLKVPTQRFPCWYRNTKTGELHRFNLNQEKIEKPVDGGRWQPVRFVSVCEGGHLCEFPWKQWIGCTCKGDGNLFLTDHGGSDLSSIKIECKTCRKSENLSGATFKSKAGETSKFQKKGINCSGDRPWLGEGANESGCTCPLVGALINQTNIFFPRTISAITIPDSRHQSSSITCLRNEIENDSSAVGGAVTLWRMGDRKNAIKLIVNSLNERAIQNTSKQVEEALCIMFDEPAPFVYPIAMQPTDNESELLAFRRAEFNVIRNPVEDPEKITNLRVIPADIDPVCISCFSRVNLVEKLRELRVFYGFDRLEQSKDPLAGMPQKAMNQLFREPPTEPYSKWLPAVEVFGEGIYIELDEKRIFEWQRDQKKWIAERINDAFLSRLAGISQTLPPQNGPTLDWASRYMMVHSLAHILINQFVFECGYGTASLRERLYVSADPNAPMAAFLIYTAAGDSEGTLGGLVRLGRKEKLGQIVRRALARAFWCSADPVCSEQLGGTGSRLANLAACHACILLPETSCETINQGLDRAMVVGTPKDRKCGFMSDLIENVYELG